MFSRLPESNAVRQRRTGGFVVSTVVHVLVIALAVHATMLTATPRPHVDAPVLIYTAPPEPTPTTTRAPVPRPTTAAPTAAAPTIPDLPSPVITPDVPSTLPAIDATILDGREEFGRPTPMSGPETTGGSPNVTGGPPLTAAFVEKVVVAIPGTATPRYPDMLRQAGVEGDVHAQFVVDTLGRVEQGSVRVLDTTHDQFAAAVRTALARARFKPAEVGGNKVRQLVEQTFTFRIGGKD